jgi:hypothetical protein
VSWGGGVEIAPPPKKKLNFLIIFLVKSRNSKQFSIFSKKQRKIGWQNLNKAEIAVFTSCILFETWQPHALNQIMYTKRLYQKLDCLG